MDDLLAGIKSTALRFGDNTKIWLSFFSTGMISGLTTAGFVCDQTWPYYTTVGLVGLHLAQQIYSLNINNPSDCARKFISNHQVGLLLFVGIVLGSLLKTKNNSDKPKSVSPTATATLLPNFNHSDTLIQR